MTRRLYTNSKIIIPDPFVIRVDHGYEADSSAFRRFTKLARNIVQGTYGYTSPDAEVVQIRPIDPKADLLTALFADDKDIRIRSYWFFEDTMDATAFRLSIGEKAEHIFMWPDRLLFTVHEK